MINLYQNGFQAAYGWRGRTMVLFVQRIPSWQISKTTLRQPENMG
ncbi:hypothetical protein [Kingella sp. (in: b-proteobacteria)]|nr:hypothetical protein [Kingella sp. (in: b-proteobacteria)]MDO4658363.1 hypothetical protein [Kingella sp. (in: b-proteobacteria)]